MNLLSILFIYMPANNKGLKRGLLGVLFAGVAGVVAAMFLSDQKNRKVIVDKAKKVGKATKKATKKVKSGVVKQAKKISKKISKK
jgi:gas vesicle protein